MRRPSNKAGSDVYRFGIEEEYFLVDPHTGRIKTDLAGEFIRLAQHGLGPRVPGS